MTHKSFSFRVVVVSGSDVDRDLFEQALAALPMPVDFVALEGPVGVGTAVSIGADILYLDDGLAPAEISLAIAATRAAPKPPFTVLMTGPDYEAGAFATDALAIKPLRIEEAKRFVARSVRVRLPSRVLIVDDSSTMRSIVRKLLDATRFPIDVTEADEGFAALKLVRESDFDLVFLDYTMPGFSGLETLAEFKREKRRVNVVIMTSATDELLEDRAREQGAAFLKKPFFPADIDAVLCRLYGLHALNPKRN